FKNQYQKLFGHYPSGRAIELESLKVVVGTKVPKPSKVNREITKYIQNTFKIASKTPVYQWDDLQKDVTIEGPAILLNITSTAFIESSWQAGVQQDKNIIISKSHLVTQSHQMTFESEVIDLELFTNRFTNIAEEMGAQLQRTAFSVNVKERLDFSCAILDANAELLVNAPHIPVHLGSLGICVRLVKEKIKLGKGDVIITNHPKYGGSHLPDVTLLTAVFSDKDELIGYVINRAHHAEIGGKRPGSMPPDAKNLIEEGVVIPPMYLVKNGEIQWESLENLLKNAPYPTRALEENLADMNAALASLRTGEAALQKLVQEHSLEKVHHYMAALKQSATEALQNALKSIENQTFIAEEFLDDGHKICAEISIKNGQIEIDFDGTSAVHPGNLNANISIVYSAVIYVLRLLCNKEIPLNEGLMQNVQIHLPKDSFLHPNFSDNDLQNPAVVGGNTEVSQRLVDTLLKALNLAACSQGTMNNFLFGNERFGYYETIGGGTGASEGWHGRSAVHQHMTNTKITDPEELEFRYPVYLHQFSVRTNSGGKGQWNGGDGIIREIEFLEDLEITILSQHRKEAPYGLENGEAGKIGQQTLIRKNGVQKILLGIASEKVESGDRLIIETPGGGGFGSFEAAVTD
ncbi:MAG: hydantoinase B/oxoprolinase family protein, partial [Saprospiraceae bacterium]|nr:hydantoinase B/oxoprolinase family protein [Saprospiraceae bacterium]